MKMYLLCLDSEGTIRQKNKIIPNLSELLKEFERVHTIPVLVTGLPKHIIDKIYDNVYEFPYQILSNGSQIYDAKAKKIIFYKAIPNVFLQFLIEKRDRYHFHLKVTVHGNEYTTLESEVNEHTTLISFDDICKLSDYCQVYVMADSFVSLEEKKKRISLFNSTTLNKKETQSFSKLVQENKIEQIFNFVMFIEMKNLREEILDFGGIRISNDSLDGYSFKHTKEPFWFSINEVSVTKENALNVLSDYLKVKKDDIIVIGNDKNDMDMLSNNFYSITIKNPKKKINVKDGISIRQKQLEFVLYYLLSYLFNGLSLYDFKCDIQKEKQTIPLITRLSDSDEDISMIRFAARGIILNKNKEVILFYKDRIGEIKLPGGGIEKKEKPLEAFIREVKEETGCLLKDLSLIGYTIERKTKNDFKQVSFVFQGEVTMDTKQLSLTDEEFYNWGKTKCLSIEETLYNFKNAKKKLKNLDSMELYHEQFIVERDYHIFKFFKKVSR